MLYASVSGGEGAAAFTIVESDEKDSKRSIGKNQRKSTGIRYYAGAVIGGQENGF